MANRWGKRTEGLSTIGAEGQAAISFMPDVNDTGSRSLLGSVLFSSSHAWMWELDYKESWASKKGIDAFELWCWRRLLRVPWTARRSNQSILNQSWIFIARTDAKAKTLIFWPSDTKNGLIGKDSDTGKDWGQEEKETIEDEMVGWHHQLDGHEFEQGLGVGDGQGSLACCSPWGHKQSDTTVQLNWFDVQVYI